MSLEQTHSSLELSKFLQERGFEGESEYGHFIRHGHPDKPIVLMPSGSQFSANEPWELVAPAYDILNDLCVKYAKEVFGKAPHDIGEQKLTHMQEVIDILNFDSKEEAELYIKNNCILNNN